MDGWMMRNNRKFQITCFLNLDEKKFKLELRDIKKQITSFRKLDSGKNSKLMKMSSPSIREK